MIWLHSDCLVVKTAQGESIPCSAEAVTVELVGEAAASLDPEIMRHAARAVLHYFREELQRDTVTVAEFAEALARVLQRLGLQVKLGEDVSSVPTVVEADLQMLATDVGVAFELGFFHRLRDEVRLRLEGAPGVVRFRGLRECVRVLTGLRRWNHRCQALNDQIVDFLRQCWSADPRTRDTALVVE